TEIDPNETAGELHDRLMEIGGETVIKTLRLIENANANPVTQPETPDMKTAHKLNRENCRIDWAKPAGDIHNLIRGLSPHPGAHTFIKDNDQERNVKIYQADAVLEAHQLAVGKIIATKKELKVAVKDGFTLLKSLQFPGKKKM